MKRVIWKTAVLNWVMLMAAANSNPSQPNWRIAGSYASATACIAGIGQSLAENSITSSITSEITGWASSQLGSVASAPGTGAAAPTDIAPMVCLPDTSPWVASLGGAGPGGALPGGPPASGAGPAR